MIEIENSQLRTELNELVAKYGKSRSSLMPILHELQNKYRGIPEDAMQILADILNMHAVEVQEVATFYNFYNTGEKGKFIIRMCETMPCKMQGAKEVANKLEEELNVKFGETTPDKMFTLEWTSCIGMCDQGPALLVNDKPYTRVKPEKIGSIIRAYREEGR